MIAHNLSYETLARADPQTHPELADPQTHPEFAGNEVHVTYADVC
jgi:hypothetical protein